ncbi:MAG: cyclodeaminase/cyclohydrolase family protein, partial [Acidobacteriota bacterium]
RLAAEKGNKNSLSDAGVAGLLAEAAAAGAHYNIQINLPNIRDDTFKDDVRSKAAELSQRVAQLAAAVKALIEKDLSQA